MVKLLSALVIMLCVYSPVHAQIFTTVGPVGFLSKRSVSVDISGSSLDLSQSLGLPSRRNYVGAAGLIVFPGIAARAEWLSSQRELGTGTLPQEVSFGGVSMGDVKEAKSANIEFSQGSLLLETAYLQYYLDYRIAPLLTTDIVSTKMKLTSLKDSKSVSAYEEVSSYAIMGGFYMDRPFEDFVYFCKAAFGFAGTAKVNMIDVGVKSKFNSPARFGGGYRYKSSLYSLKSVDIRQVDKGLYVEVEIIW